MLFTLGLFIATAFMLGLLASIFVPMAWSVGAALSLSTLQLYTLPVAGIYLSGAHLGALATWRGVGERDVWRQGWFRAAIAMLAIQIVSATWSPSPTQAIRQVLYGTFFFFLVPAVYALLIARPALMRKILLVALYMTLIEAFLVIAFRAAPSVKLHFLGSSAAQFFLSANALSELGTGAYSVADPGKSGGLLLNANVGAVFLGVSSMIAWGAARLLRSRYLVAVAVIDFVAVLLAGSKAAIAIGLGLVAFMYGMKVVRAREMSIGAAAAICFGAVAAIAGGMLLVPLLLKSSYVAGSTETLGTRFAIWEFAFQILRAHPFTGLGFGGWELKWPDYALARGLSPLFPPHNAFIALFAQSGIAAVLAGAAFLVLCLRFVWSDIAARDPDLRRFSLGLLCALLWVFIQAQGENFGFIGEPHITPMMAAGMALLLFFRREGALQSWKTLK